MWQQTGFLFILYLLGLLIAFPYKRRLPWPFLLLTAPFLGALVWVLASLFFLVTGIPYHWPLVLFALGFFGGYSIWRAVRAKCFFFLSGELKWLAVISAGMGGLAVFVHLYNFTIVTPDSFYLLFNGRAFAVEGFSGFLHSQLILRGVFVQLLQSAGVLIGADYLYGLQPFLSLIFGFVFIYMAYRIIRHWKASFLWVGLTFVGVFSTYFIIFQMFYLHNNLLSGMYLYITLAAFWLALAEKNINWLEAGLLSLTAFSLLRIEAPLFAVLFLALFISMGYFSRRELIRVIGPYLAAMIAWNGFLLFNMGKGSYILNPAYSLMIIGALVALGVLLLIMDLDWIKKIILPHIVHWISGSLLMVFGTLVAFDPRFNAYLVVLVEDMAWYGAWGWAWFLAGGLLLLCTGLPKFPAEKLFTGSFTAFFLLLPIVYSRNPVYQLNWGDSANRMLTHIFPLLFLYLLMKLTYGLNGSYDINPKEEGQKRSWLMAAGGGLVAFALGTLFF